MYDSSIYSHKQLTSPTQQNNQRSNTDSWLKDEPISIEINNVLEIYGFLYLNVVVFS